MDAFSRSLNVTRAFWVAVLLAGVAGCGSDVLGPFQPQLSNQQDSFSLQASGVTTVSSTLTYSWSNSGTRATVNHSTTTSAGSIVLVMKDAAGTTVYNKALSSSLNEPTATGVAGNWTVQLTLSNYSGTINFRAEKL